MPHLSPMNWILTPMMLALLLLTMMIIMWWQTSPKFIQMISLKKYNLQKLWKWW